MIRRRLLAILFICILLPVVIMFVQSMTTMISQRQGIERLSKRYARNLAEYAAERYHDSSEERIRAFLSLLADPDYNMAISIEEGAGRNQRAKTDIRTIKEKFIPGLAAYVDSAGNLIAHSQNAAILASVFDRAPLITVSGRFMRGGSVVSNIAAGGKKFTYFAYIQPTANPNVYAVAAVTLHSWVGRGGFDMMKLAAQGFISMFAALVALFLLRTYLIIPLQALASQVNSLKWGREMPASDPPRELLGFQVEEIRSLNSAIADLAKRTLEKEELEKRYMNDILKAQEDERRHIAQDIHDGPIQVVAALIQRIQMASIAANDISDETRDRLSEVEGVAQDAVEELRGICDSLVPPWLSLGIASCIEEAARRFERLYNVKISMNVDHALDLDQEAMLALYRIFNEAVSNAVRHGKATEINVGVSRADRDGGARLFISDNGSGFLVDKSELSQLPLMGKRGLSGMRQRAELLGGTCDLKSSPGEGTAITVVLPRAKTPEEGSPRTSG